MPYYGDQLAPIISGQIIPPNFERVDLASAVAGMVIGNHWPTVKGRFLHPNGKFYVWACYSLKKTQGDTLTGEGLVLYYIPALGVAEAGHFAICKHEIEETSTVEERRRGWHQRHCTKCSLDLTYDSGD